MRGAVPAGRHRRRPGRATPHLHAVLGLADGTTHGGHLLEGRVWPKLEVVIKDSPVALAEVHGPELGPALIDLPSACRRDPCPRRPPAEARRRGSSRVAVGRQHPSGGTGRSFRDPEQPADEEPVRPSTGGRHSLGHLPESVRLCRGDGHDCWSPRAPARCAEHSMRGRRAENPRATVPTPELQHTRPEAPAGRACRGLPSNAPLTGALTCLSPTTCLPRTAMP
ncbi:PCC domain-containing protein [Streptomyces sp. NPDC058770]|uniref:PCC domain-containing protein n=1 Tax=Streptomyces sp. NPDC058770 TaxID=3346631 RepID=UPI0036D12BBA